MKTLSLNRVRLGLWLLPASLALLAVVTGGCATQLEIPSQITQDLLGIRAQLQQGKTQVQLTCNAARDLTQRSKGNLDPQIKHLLKCIDDLETLAFGTRKDFTKASENAEAYFTQWDKQMADLSASLAEKGQVRRAESMASFKVLDRLAAELRNEVQPYMRGMHEVSTYLRTDTTTAGVGTVTPEIEKALKREKAVMARVDAVVAQIDAMCGGR